MFAVKPSLQVSCFVIRTGFGLGDKRGNGCA